jgi:integrase
MQIYRKFLSESIARACEGKDREGLLFGDGLHHQPHSNSTGGWFVNAVKNSQKIDPSFPTITPHDLRHTAASLAISAGANVKAVQRMLGHASAAMTLDTYADLFEDDLDDVSERLDAARAETVVGFPWGLEASGMQKTP